MQIKNENRGLISSSGQFTSTLSQKGQVTIPAKIRDYIDAKAGDQIQFVIEGDNVFVNVVKKILCWHCLVLCHLKLVSRICLGKKLDVELKKK
ncbi:hypothetical protein bthur0004_54790 [Bacillus thuringiensis serovar sotto str. T04001]|nr:hypothetical protein bthur0004_54790 [Bacillus thuringiensis serovar sotto str. T04001]